MSEVQQMDRKELKIQALLEKVASLTAQYENQVADLRVDLTVVSQELQSAHAAAAEANETEAPAEDPDVQETSTKSRK